MRAVRHGRAALLAAAIAVAYGALTAGITASELGELAAHGRPSVSPIGAAASVAGIVLAVVTFGGLGLFVRRAGGSRGEAVRAGVLAGAIAGAATGLFRSLAVRDYLARAVGSYGIDLVVLDALLAVGTLVAVPLGAALGALLTWLGFRLPRA